MNDPPVVRGFEASRDLNPKAQDLLDRQRLPRQVLLERRTLQQFHHQEVLHGAIAVCDAADIVDGADVGVTETGRCSSLVLKPFYRIGIGAKFGREELHCDLSAEPQVARGVDHSHAAGVNTLNDLVMRNRIARDRERCPHGVPMSL